MASEPAIIQRQFIKVKLRRLLTLSDMPNEVMGMIVARVHDQTGGGRENLRNLCLVSKRLYDIARRDLYFTVPVQTPNQLASITRTLIEKPTTRSLVHTVLISIDTVGFTKYNDAAPTFSNWASAAINDSQLSQRDRQLLVLCKATCGKKASENLQYVLGLFMFLLDHAQHLSIFPVNNLNIVDRFLAAGLSLLASNSSNELDFSLLFPALTSLDICSKTWLQRSSQTFFGKVFQPTLALAASSPQLIDFAFKGPEGELASVLEQWNSDVEFPFKKILLRGSNWTASSLCVLLRRCPEVLHLEVETTADSGNYADEEDINKVLPKYCPKLQVLSIRYFGHKTEFFGTELFGNRNMTCLPEMIDLRELRIELDSFVGAVKDLGDLDLAQNLPDRLEKLFLDASSVRFQGGSNKSNAPKVLAYKEQVKRIIEDLCETRAEEIPLPRLDTIAVGCKFSKPKQWTRAANDTMSETDAKLRVFTASDAKTLWAKSFEQMNV
ncbi:hypothetical protein BDP55DRAFT_552540 [Colletotrichum godetiae]|uniref:F-box domain-containing protein n=1 Tax=Colletotrichum godetiae TaxID=1209918 RepID=A0AAJ0EXQ2_9PEZI|nr:uncharacterized protein BDP55DRAFT_552540 [Colletotrichum godetiae]KAK1675430.1 hypothetical protein BDP55DRAFT_552540 [Colletotrichum godetiae]